MFATRKKTEETMDKIKKIKIGDGNGNGKLREDPERIHFEYCSTCQAVRAEAENRREIICR